MSWKPQRLKPLMAGSVSETRKSTPSTVGAPSGERAARAVTNSGSKARRRTGSSSGLVNTRATLGASSSSPRLVSAVPPVLVQSQPSMPSWRGITVLAPTRRRIGKRPNWPDVFAGPGVDGRDLHERERQLERRLQDAAVLDRHPGRGELQAVRLVRARDAPASGLDRERERLADDGGLLG